MSIKNFLILIFFIIHLKQMPMELLKEVVNFFRFTTYLFDVTHHYDVLQKAVIRLLEAISKEASLENSAGSA